MHSSFNEVSIQSSFKNGFIIYLYVAWQGTQRGLEIEKWVIADEQTQSDFATNFYNPNESTIDRHVRAEHM